MAGSGKKFSWSQNTVELAINILVTAGAGGFLAKAGATPEAMAAVWNLLTSGIGGASFAFNAKVAGPVLLGIAANLPHLHQRSHILSLLEKALSEQVVMQQPKATEVNDSSISVPLVVNQFKFSRDLNGNFTMTFGEYSATLTAEKIKELPIELQQYIQEQIEPASCGSKALQFSDHAAFALLIGFGVGVGIGAATSLPALLASFLAQVTTHYGLTGLDQCFGITSMSECVSQTSQGCNVVSAFLQSLCLTRTENVVANPSEREPLINS